MDPKQILKKYGLSKTKTREKILEVLLNTDVALSEKEIGIEIREGIDRATIYRSLNRFAECGIVHTIATDTMQTKFILKKETGEHLHFKCSACGNIFCLPEIAIQEFELPEGFTRQETNFLIIGKCKNCN